MKSRAITALLASLLVSVAGAEGVESESALATHNCGPSGELRGDPERGRLVFAPCRTCHYPEAFMGHNNGPNLHRIFGKVAGKQEGFEYYSETFKAARFVWTPVLLYNWLENPMAMFPDTSMMSLGVPDPQQRADLIAFLMRASVREVSDPNASQ